MRRNVEKDIEELQGMLRRMHCDYDDHTARKCAAGCQSLHRRHGSIRSRSGRPRSSSSKRQSHSSFLRSGSPYNSDTHKATLAPSPHAPAGESVLSATWKSTQTTVDKATTAHVWSDSPLRGSQSLRDNRPLTDRGKTEAPKVPYGETKIDPGQPVDYYARSIQKYASQRTEAGDFGQDAMKLRRISTPTRDSNQSLYLDAKVSITDLSSELRSLHHEMQRLSERKPCESCRFLIAKGFSSRHCWAHSR